MIGTWGLRGECRKYDPDVWFPASDERTSKGRADRTVAKTVCSGCPVLAECRAYALEAGEEFGVWGGLSEGDRRAIRRGHRHIIAETAPPGVPPRAA